jgi:hypothetical protein
LTPEKLHRLNGLPHCSIMDDRQTLFCLRTVRMFGTMLSIRWNWQKLFSYGEVVCFISAWAIGLLIAMQGQRPSENGMAARTFASASDALGIQAKLGR